MKTRIRLLLLICLFLGKVQAQNVCFSIFEESIKTKNDTLYLRFKVHNRTANKLAFYNINYADFDGPWATNNFLKKDVLPRLLFSVLDKENKYSKYLRSRTGPYDISTFKAIINKYIILKPNESVEYNIKLCLWPINLKRGRYKVQLKYFLNNYYQKDFNKAKKKDRKLDNCVLFKGVVKSNVCWFNYVP